MSALLIFNHCFDPIGHYVSHIKLAIFLAWLKTVIQILALETYTIIAHRIAHELCYNDIMNIKMGSGRVNNVRNIQSTRPNQNK